MKTAALVRTHFPDLPILARARNRVHYFRLRDLGIEADLARDLSVEPRNGASGAAATRPRRSARRSARSTLFQQHDEAQLEAQYAVRHDEAQLIQTTQQAAAQLKELFETDSINLLRPGAGVPTH